MNMYTMLFKFKEDFTTFQDHISEVLLQSGLLLDEHEYQIVAHYETSKLMKQIKRDKKIYRNQILIFFHHIMTILVFRNISRYLESYYKTLFSDLIKCCRNQSAVNIAIKRHFERRLLCIKILDIGSSLKESTLLQHEVDFLNDSSLLLTQTTKSMMAIKESVINSKMVDLGFQLFESKYTKGSDLDECLNFFNVNVDIFVYNTSEFLTALVLSVHQPFQLDDAATFYNLNVVIPNFLKTFKSSLNESETNFEKTKYLLTLKDQPNSTALSNPLVNFNSEDLINRNICETLRHLQLAFEIVTKIHKNYNTSRDISDRDLNSVQVCLKKTLESISYLDKANYIKSNKKSEDNEVLPTEILTKEAKKIVVNYFDEDPVDEVFSCYISDNSDVAITKQYDDLFQNYTSQKMLITELQEKLDLLNNLKGRKIAPEPGDQLIPTKKKIVAPPVNNLEESTAPVMSLPPPVPPKLPVCDILPVNYSMTRSLSTQVQEIANRNKRKEEIFGSEQSSTDSD